MEPKLGRDCVLLLIEIQPDSDIVPAPGRHIWFCFSSFVKEIKKNYWTKKGWRMGQISFHFIFLLNGQTAKLLNSGLKVIICSLKALSLILILYFLCGIGWHFSLILYLICCMLKTRDFMYLCPSHYLP